MAENQFHPHQSGEENSQPQQPEHPAPAASEPPPSPSESPSQGDGGESATGGEGGTLLGADVGGPIDATAIVDGNGSDLGSPLLAFDNGPADTSGVVGSDLINASALDNPLLGADVDGTTAVVGGDTSQVNDALITANVDTPVDEAVTGNLLDTGNLVDTGNLLNTNDIGLLQSGALDQPLVGAEASGPVEGTAVVGGDDASDASSALITADVSAPDDTTGTSVDLGNVLDTGGVGDALDTLDVHTS